MASKFGPAIDDTQTRRPTEILLDDSTSNGAGDPCFLPPPVRYLRTPRLTRSSYARQCDSALMRAAGPSTFLRAHMQRLGTHPQHGANPLRADLVAVLPPGVLAESARRLNHSTSCVA